MRAKLLKVAIPYLIESLLMTMAFYIVSWMLGSVSSEAVASMGIVGPIMYTVQSILFAVSIGTVALVSRAVGEGDRVKIAQCAATCLYIAVVVGVAFAFVAILLLPSLAMLFDAPGNPGIARGAADYIAASGFLFLFMSVELVSGGIMRSFGNARTPMLIGFAVNIVNLFLSYCLIFGKFGFPQLGLMGAAYASVMSMILHGVVLFALLFTRASGAGFSFKELRFSRAALDSFLKVSLPAVIEPVTERTGFLIYTRIVSELGPVSLAAHRAAVIVESITYMPGQAFSGASSVLVGQSLGEKSPKRARAAVGVAARISCYFMMVIGILFLLFPSTLIGMFVPKDKEAIALGSLVLAIASIEQPFFALTFVFVGALRGAGYTKATLFVSIIGTWVVRLPLAYTLAIVFGLGLVGVWITMIADWTARTILAYLIWSRGSWTKIKL